MASQAKQGQLMNWHNVEKRKISWRRLWAMDANHIKFIGATYDVLPTLQNLSQWVGEDRSWKLCMGVGSFKHIMSGGKTSLVARIASIAIHGGIIRF